jgi:hypothetical protein
MPGELSFLEITLDLYRYLVLYLGVKERKQKMRKVYRFKNTAEPEFVEKGGVTYKVIDLGGTKMNIRVKEDKEIKKDSKLFKLSKS